MHFKTFFTMTALLLLTAKGDPDPRTFYASTPSTLFPSPSPLPEFEEKEVIAYLTQEQIEDLKTGRGILESVHESQTQSEDGRKNLEAVNIAKNNYDDNQLKSLLEQRNQYIKSQSDVVLIGNQNVKWDNLPMKNSNEQESQEALAQIPWYPRENNRYQSSAAKQERNRYFAVTSERPESNRNFATASEKPANNKYYALSTERADNSDYYTATSEKPDNLNHKSINYYNVYNEKKGDNIDIKIFHPTSKDTLNNERSKALDTEKENRSNKRYKLASYTLRNEDETRSQKYEQENSKEYERNLDEVELTPKYTIRYSDQQRALDIQGLIKKQNVQAEVSARRPVEVVRKLNTENKLQEPARQSYLVHVAQPVEVKAQETYSLPLELIRRVPIAREDTEEEKSVSYQVKRPAPTSGSKQVYVKVDKPYLVERIVPVDVREEASVQATPQKQRILERVWEHYN